MEICVRSSYSYLICESRFDTAELTQRLQEGLKLDFGSTYGWSATEGAWEPVVITETEVIEMLKDEGNKGRIVYGYLGDGEWEEWSLADFMSETLDNLADENGREVDRGQRVLHQITL